jgi:hypothetical protein
MLNVDQAPAEARELLGKRISQLGLRIEGSRVERFVQQLYRELERKGLRKFHPVCYLTDEWGCPDGQPVIGIPFYLADPRLAQLEKAINDLESDRSIMMYMRHEAGHAINYAYGCTAPRHGGICSDRFTACIAITTGRCRSAGNTCATSKVGTHRSIPTRTSPKRSPCG